MKQLIVALLACLSILSCTSSHVLTGTVRPEIDPSQVKIYSHPPANFEEVAILTASSRSSWAVTEQGRTNVVIEGLKEEAASLGANGVILQGLQTNRGDTVAISSGQAYGNTYGSSTNTYGTGTTVYASGTYKTGQAIAIYVQDVGISSKNTQSIETKSKSELVQECIDACVKASSKSPEVCFDGCTD